MSIWEPRQTEDGSWTLYNQELDEACHSRDGAWMESVERYAKGCRLPERAAELVESDGEGVPLRVLDIGTGLGLNIAAARSVLAGCGVLLQVTSLELDPDVIRAGLELPPANAWQASIAAGLAQALEKPGEVIDLGTSPAGEKESRASLELHLGHGAECLAAIDKRSRFDAVFMDPFSPAVDRSLWGAPFLREISSRMKPGSMLSTFSSAIRVRRTLEEVGLLVGPGLRVGSKSSGTLASPDRSLPAFPAAQARRMKRAAVSARAKAEARSLKAEEPTPNQGPEPGSET